MPQPSPSGVAVRVRDAQRSDRRAVRAVLLAAYREYATVLPPAVFGPYLADILDLDDRERAGRQLVAEHGGRVAGTVTFYEDAAAEGLGWPAGWAGLRALGVDPVARRLGVGQALMDACRERALAARAPVLCLHTAAFMPAAVAMYEAMGFRRAPAFDFDVPAGGAPPVAILAYRLDLPDDDAVLEFPQSGERFAGKASIEGWRRPWADGGIPKVRGDLPATIRGGS